MKIREVIVVEGLHDLQKIQACVDADVIITHGTHLSNETLSQLKVLNETRGIIVFTDPDGPGARIRNRIIESVGNCKHASLSTRQSRHKNKVGIEHASCTDIKESLKEAATYDTMRNSLTWEVYVALGFMGQEDSKAKRDYLSTVFNMPVGNGKRLFKYLNMMGKTEADVIEALKEWNDGNHCE